MIMNVRVLLCVSLFILLSALCHSLVENDTGCPTYSTKAVLPLCDISIYEICELRQPCADCLDEQRRDGKPAFYLY